MTQRSVSNIPRARPVAHPGLAHCEVAPDIPDIVYRIAGTPCPWVLYRTPPVRPVIYEHFAHRWQPGLAMGARQRALINDASLHLLDSPRCSSRHGSKGGRTNPAAQQQILYRFGGCLWMSASRAATATTERGVAARSAAATEPEKSGGLLPLMVRNSSGLARDAEEGAHTRHSGNMHLDRSPDQPRPVDPDPPATAGPSQRLSSPFGRGPGITFVVASMSGPLFTTSVPTG